MRTVNDQFNSPFYARAKYVVLQVFKCLNKRTVLSHGSCFNRSSFVATLFCDALRTSVQSKGKFNTAFSMRSMHTALHSRISFSIVPRFRLRTYAQFSDFSPFLHRIMHDHWVVYLNYQTSSAVLFRVFSYRLQPRDQETPCLLHQHLEHPTDWFSLKNHARVRLGSIKLGNSSSTSSRADRSSRAMIWTEMSTARSSGPVRRAQSAFDRLKRGGGKRSKRWVEEQNQSPWQMEYQVTTASWGRVRDPNGCRDDIARPPSFSSWLAEE